MKKLIFVSLLVIPFCKAADDIWYQAIKDQPNIRQQLGLNLMSKGLTTIPNLDLSNLRTLILSNNKLTSFPDNFNLHSLRNLYLDKNDIKYVDPNILSKLPNLEDLDLSNNPITRENVAKLKAEATRLGCHVNIIANNIFGDLLMGG